MPPHLDILLEAQSLGILSADEQALISEAAKRGLLPNNEMNRGRDLFDVVGESWPQRVDGLRAIMDYHPPSIWPPIFDFAKLAFIPPLLLLALGYIGLWVGRGFKRSDADEK